MRWMALVGSVIALLLFVASAEEDKDKKAKGEEGFVSLFNGKDLTGWHIMGTPSWQVEDGVLVCTGKGGGWLRSEKQYENFTLRLEFKISKGGNSGIFIRSALEGNPAFTGMEVQILDDYGRQPANWTTGAIYDAVVPKKNMSKPAGEWNRVEIICNGPWVVVSINGEEIIRVSMDEHEKLKHRLRKGYIGLQNHGARVEFRNIRIKELPSSGAKEKAS